MSEDINTEWKESLPYLEFYGNQLYILMENDIEFGTGEIEKPPTATKTKPIEIMNGFQFIQLIYCQLTTPYLGKIHNYSDSKHF